MKSLLKSWLKSDGFRDFLCWLGAKYIRFVMATSRFETLNAQIPQHYWSENKPFILAFWHGRLMIMPCIWPKGPEIHMLISAHRDGRLISKTVEYFNVQTIIGSKNKQGAQALRAILKRLKGGHSIGITPDGPRGPRMRASEGVVSIAKLSGVPVIPAGVGTRWRKHLKSWDRFMIALPFTRGVFIWGEPIFVERSADKDELDRARLQIEKAITELTNEVDHLCGCAPIEPDRSAL